jgi:hypothetical protein
MLSVVTNVLLPILILHNFPSAIKAETLVKPIPSTRLVARLDTVISSISHSFIPADHGGRRVRASICVIRASVGRSSLSDLLTPVGPPHQSVYYRCRAPPNLARRWGVVQFIYKPVPHPFFQPRLALLFA